MDEVLSCFKIRAVDFNQSEFRCYKIGRIGGLVRIDADEIITDEHLPTQNKTEFGSQDSEPWLLSKGILRHDEEIEKETQNVIDVLTETMGDTLSTDEKVTLVGFGTFQAAKKRKKRSKSSNKRDYPDTGKENT